MPQFKYGVRPIMPPRQKLANEYWKLEIQPSHATSTYTLRSMLNDCDYYFEPSAKQERLLELFMRCSRGLLSYDKYTTEELEKFAADRGLAGTLEMEKDDLIATLEQVDYRCIFKRLFDLPPELRNEIYRLHFSSFDVCAMPVSPSITQASRQLREETFKLFYHTCIAKFSFSDHNLAPKDTTRMHKRGRRVTANENTAALFSCMPEHLLGNIRRFELVGKVSGKGFKLYEKWLVDLSKDTDDGLLGLRGSPFAQTAPPIYAAARTKLEERIKAQLRAIAGRDGERKLRRPDLELLERMFMLPAD